MDDSMFGEHVSQADLQHVAARGDAEMASEWAARLARTAMSWLSDAQEEMAMGLTERSRQTINRAKFLLDQIGSEGR